jgi:hypothetical protein
MKNVSSYTKTWADVETYDQLGENSFVFFLQI